MWLATRNAAYIRVTQAVADRQMDTQMYKHCATIRVSLACASRANSQLSCITNVPVQHIINCWFPVYDRVAKNSTGVKVEVVTQKCIWAKSRNIDSQK